MTLPRERTRALLNTREFLRSLLDPQATPRVPKEVRRMAYWCLKHFPGNVEIRESAEALPNIWELPEDEEHA